MLGKIVKYYLVWQAVKQLQKALSGGTPARSKRRFRRS
jgi:hypothetical protein